VWRWTGFAFDARWKYVAGESDFDYPGFVHTVLVVMHPPFTPPLTRLRYSPHSLG
jgi:hypothetical protein